MQRPAGFDGQQWYQQLYDYGMSASFGPGDADEELIPHLVKELVLPLAQHVLQNVWNPASRRQSTAAAAMVADLLVYVPPDDTKMQVSLSCFPDNNLYWSWRELEGDGKSLWSTQCDVFQAMRGPQS